MATKLRLVETGRVTTRTYRDEDNSVHGDWWRTAADRLVNRDWQGHFADFGSTGGVNSECGAEVCRAIGGLTERTGIFVHFEVVQD